MDSNIEAMDTITDFFFVKHKNSLHKIRLKNILYIQSDQNYCTVHLKDKKFTVKISLVNFLKKMPGHKFKRIHRSYIVGVKWMDEINFTDGIITIEGKELPIGGNYKQDLISGIAII